MGFPCPCLHQMPPLALVAFWRSWLALVDFWGSWLALVAPPLAVGAHQRGCSSPGPALTLSGPSVTLLLVAKTVWRRKSALVVLSNVAVALLALPRCFSSPEAVWHRKNVVVALLAHPTISWVIPLALVKSSNVAVALLAPTLFQLTWLFFLAVTCHHHFSCS